MKRILFTFVLSFVLLTTGLFAANPVSLLSFNESYSHLPIIQTIQQNNQFDGNVGAFLLNESNTISEKLAVMNALIGHNQFNNSAETFKMFLGRKHKTNFETLDFDILSGEELLCLGYLTLIDNNGDPEKAMSILEKATSKSPDSKATQMIYSLVAAQEMINKGQKCEAWKSFDATSNNNALTDDIDAQIAGRISNEMQVFSEGCN